MTNIVIRGNSDLVFALTKTIFTQATITQPEQWICVSFGTQLAIICPTTVEKEVSMRYSVCFPPRNKRFATNWGNSDHYVNDVLYWSTRQKQRSKKTVYTVRFGKNHE